MLLVPFGCVLDQTTVHHRHHTMASDLLEDLLSSLVIQQELDEAIHQAKLLHPSMDESRVESICNAAFHNCIVQMAGQMPSSPPVATHSSGSTIRITSDPSAGAVQSLYTARYSAAARGPRSLEDVLKELPPLPSIPTGAIWKAEGAALYGKMKFTEARTAFYRAMQDILGVPVVETPLTLDERRFILVMSCASNCVQCAIKEEKTPLVRIPRFFVNQLSMTYTSQALEWIQHIFAMFLSRFTIKDPVFGKSLPLIGFLAVADAYQRGICPRCLMALNFSLYVPSLRFCRVLTIPLVVHENTSAPSYHLS